MPTPSPTACRPTAYRQAAAIFLLAAAAIARPAEPATVPAPPASAPPTPAAAARPAVANPHYVTLELRTTVERPAAAVWARVGKYCDIAEWMRFSCMLSSGRDGEIGAVRTLRNSTLSLVEILVGRSEFSYTYTQPVMEGRPYNLYHGTLEARPLTAGSATLIYTVVYDDSLLPDDAARQADRERRRSSFTAALQNMKTLAEGGTLAPAPDAAPR